MASPIKVRSGRKNFCKHTESKILCLMPACFLINSRVIIIFMIFHPLFHRFFWFLSRNFDVTWRENFILTFPTLSISCSLMSWWISRNEIYRITSRHSLSHFIFCLSSDIEIKCTYVVKEKPCRKVPLKLCLLCLLLSATRNRMLATATACLLCSIKLMEVRERESENEKKKEEKEDKSTFSDD